MKISFDILIALKYISRKSSLRKMYCYFKKRKAIQDSSNKIHVMCGIGDPAVFISLFLLHD
jgi:hypothetical protein